MTDETPDGKPVRIASVNVRSADQPISAHAARIVGGLRDGAYDIVDVTVEGGDRFEVTGFRREEGECLHAVIGRQAGAYPDAVAVLAGERRVTYRELDERAEALAGRLRELGVGRESRVAVCLPRSPELVIAALAVLKAGGVYVPLDPALPAKRREFILADTQASVIITEVGATSGVRGQQAVSSAEDLAYIMYTSGSTGTPKGVMVSHRAALNYLQNMGTRWGLGPGDVALQLAHPSFSASIRDLFGPLLHGATVELLTDEQLRSPDHLVERLTGGVTCVLSCFPSLLRTVLEVWPDARTATLRFVMIISEPAPPGLLAQAKRVWGPDVRLIHQYGLTECAMTSLWWTPDTTDLPDGRLPIGHPIPNTTAHILTDDLQPVPPGTVGTLYIGGTGLSRGYLNRPGLTAEMFVPDPFSGPGGRLFRTGDLARQRPDGAIELIGRQDHQVKVRGFRVELGEIELALGTHEGVSEAAVALASQNSGPQLVAYVVPREDHVAGQTRGSRPGDRARENPGAEEGNARLTAAALRGFLGERLPEHMVPSRYVLLDALPRTTRGKIDRSALPELDRQRPELDEAYTAPRDATERALADIWCEVLGIDRIGVHDNVFDLGCDSLILIRALARMKARLNADIPVRQGFDIPTIAALATTLPTARRTPPPDDAPPHRISPAQRRLWYVDRLAGGTPLYTVATSWHLSGPIDVPALQRAIDYLVARHDSLRTVFTDEQGTPTAVVRDDVRVTIQTDDPTRHPFDLRTGPLFRVALLETHVLVLTAHHIIIDAHALELLLGELTLTYSRTLAGEEPALPSLPTWRPPPPGESGLDFWRETLAGAPALAGLPTIGPRPVVPGVEGAVLRWRIPAEVAEGLERIARQEGATFFMAALAAWAALLSRWSGQDDLVITVPVAGRDRVEDETYVGCLMNLLPIRVDLTGEPSYRTLLGRVRAAVVAALAHREVPFDVLVGEAASRHGGTRPLAQVLFDVEPEPTPLALAGLRTTRQDVDTGTAKADLSLTLRRGGQGLDGFLEYDTALFDEATMRLMAGQVTAMLAAADRPDARFGVIPLVGEDVAGEWDGPATPYPDECLHEMVARQARLTPDATAVAGAGGRLSYRELEDRAGELAGRLRRAGVDRGVLVGVCVPRSVELVVAVLAVLKAGGAYVPLDPAHPADRLALLIARTGTRVCVAAKGLELPVPIVAPTEIGASKRGLPDGAVDVGLDDLAAVYFTSGSSGEPKCVQITHRNWVSRVTCMRRDHRLDPGEHVLHKTALSFDDAVVEIFWPLSSGGCVAVVGAGDERSPAAIAEAVREHQARYLFLVPSMLTLIIAYARRHPDALTPLRAIFTSGETLTPDLTRQYFEAIRGPRLYNHWGVTEAGIDSTVYACSPGDGARRMVPIGRPIGNVRVYVLDAAQRPVPTGVIGELCVGGVGVGRGYLGKPGLTAERFPADPYAATPGARMYRTGDLVRRLPTGDLEFLGRRDHQVKVRGNRVELGEVESALESHAGVSRAVAAVRGDELVAYLQPADGGLRLAGLRAHLRARVPGYMVPDAYVVLDALPTLPSGKVDRGALPDRDGSRPDLDAAFVPPRTPAEQALADLWRDTLGIERVGVHDDFFDLGGHSLRAASLAARIEADFGVTLPLRDFLAAPTIDALSRLLGSAAPPRR
ncbi:non-ribosomal peptide synthetase [Acrocarpospora phusangensis]|uniref:Non-ribosomal peptide synthetase n=1 Tax=Acrocarpospora phusangensis TaxID=1070424 RepID=A0A919QHG2_9ACTN|nr:non-ribosomal peptide synthetase [Acrocarpospora phusangensis]GIH26292.1 non-ribosomal peptide synthetase [Acrocarpospora phusangensis]